MYWHFTGTGSTSIISQTEESARKSVKGSLAKQSLGFVEGDHFSVENTAAFQGLVQQFISVTNASKGEFILLFQGFFLLFILVLTFRYRHKVSTIH